MSALPPVSSVTFQGSQTYLRLVFRAFASRNYRLYFTGLAISMTGSWMQNIAMSWLIYRITKSALLLGLVGFLGQAPALFLNPLAGVLADRISKRHIIYVTQTLAALQALALAVLTIMDIIQPSHIIALTLFLGLIMPFDVTARQSFVLDVVGRKDHLGNAIALNSVLFNMARFIGPALAGVITAWKGEGICFLLNAISYCAALAAVWALDVHEPPPHRQRTHVLRELAQGISYAWRFRPARALLMLTAFVSLVGLPYSTLTPIIAQDILGGGPRALGFLNSGVGLGALAGALYLASRPTITGLGSIVGVASALFGAGLAAFALSRNFALSLAIMPLVGVGILMQLASTNTLLQTIADDQHRGRVVSLYTTAMMGLVPYGCLLYGAAAHDFGAPATLFASGMLCVAAAALYRLYLPAVQADLDAAHARLNAPPATPNGLR